MLEWCFTFHFYLLESWMGAISVGLGFISLLLSMTLKSNKLNYVFFAIYVSLFIYGLFQFESATWYEIMPLLSNIFWAVAMLFMSGQKTNIGLIFVIACWVVYAIAVNSMPNLITQIVIFFVLLYRMFLLRNESKKIAVN